MNDSQNWTKLIAVSLCIALLDGCVTNGPLHEPLYPPANTAPPTAASMVPAHVTVVENPGPATQATLIAESHSMGVVELKDAYPQAVATMLGTIYQQVDVSSTTAEAKDSDILVYLNPDFPRTVGLTFKDPEGKTLASFSQPASTLENSPSSADIWLAVIFFFEIWTIFIPKIDANHIYDRLDGEIERTVPSAIADLRPRILKTDSLMRSSKQEKQLQVSLLRAEDSLSSGNAETALEAYTDALRSVLPGSEMALQIEEKAAVAAAKLGNPPSVPTAAEELMARGKAGFNLAKSPEDFAPASADMEKALLMAPSWAIGHFNTALAEEGAGVWAHAARHLKIYLTLRPGASDREKVLEKIGELEIRQQKGERPIGAP